MKKWLLALVALLSLLTACTTKEKVMEDPGVPMMVDVKFLTPEKLEVGKEVELAVNVSQGGKNIDDAESVEFEVWESGLRDKGVMMDGKLDKDGVYKVNYTFDHDGVYYMYAHTTANGLHIMPKQKLIVGSPNMSKVLPDNSTSDTSDMNQDSK